MTQTLTTERLHEIVERRSPSLRWGEAEQIAAECLANREAQPLGYIDPANLKTYRGVMAGGSWSPVQRTLSGLNLTLPIYLAAPPAPAVPDVGDWRIDMSTGTPILMYRDCSVIESEQAEYVLSLIQPASVALVGDE